jgi:predicted RNA-binding protein YlxR (DUF448 family)
VACRTPRSKRELLRVVRTPSGEVVVDPTGRLPGRGAYLCRDAACWEVAGRRNALERALKVPVPASLLVALASSGLPGDPIIEPGLRVDGAPMGAPDATTQADQEGGPHGSK